MKTRADFLKLGYTLDNHSMPNVAYKGPRFAPTEIIPILTEREEQMLEALKLLQRMMSNLMAKGNINWGATFGIDFGLMNEALIKMDRAVARADIYGNVTNKKEEPIV